MVPSEHHATVDRHWSRSTWYFIHRAPVLPPFGRFDDDNDEPRVRGIDDGRDIHRTDGRIGVVRLLDHTLVHEERYPRDICSGLRDNGRLYDHL